MADRDDQNEEDIILNLTEDTVIAHPIAPQSDPFGFERLAKAARIFLGRDSLLQVSNDVVLSLPI